MEERIEKIIENIESNFTQLNNSVELLKKAEKTTTVATKTTSELISEFQTTIGRIEKVVKIDFANEYNKLYNTHKKLIEKVDKINFDTKFEEVNTAISNKNFDARFQEIDTKIGNINFDEQFTSTSSLITEKSSEISEFVIANNEILDSFQEIINSIPDKVSELKSNINSLSLEIKKATKSIETDQTNSLNIIMETLGKQNNEINTLKNILYCVLFLIIIGTIATIFVLR